MSTKTTKCVIVCCVENVFSLGSRMGSTHWGRPHHSVKWDWLSWWKPWHLAGEWTLGSSMWVNCLEMEAVWIAWQLRCIIAPNNSGEGYINNLTLRNWGHIIPCIFICCITLAVRECRKSRQVLKLWQVGIRKADYNVREVKAHTNTKIVGSDPAWDKGGRLLLSALCVGRDHAMCLSPIQGILHKMIYKHLDL